MTTVLVTGSTGMVGTDLVRSLAARPGVEVTGVNTSGEGGAVRWRLGREPMPDELRRPWDVVVHGAASTSWTLAPADATAANVRPVEALLDLLAPATRLVHLSTTFVVGHRGHTRSDEPSDYRNTYEWSKARCERLVAGRRGPATVVRFPIVLGRAGSGAVARLTGWHQVLGGIARGRLPAIVAERASQIDIVPVDTVADAIAAVALDPTAPPLVRIGAGPAAPTVGEVFDEIVDALADWRAEHGAPPLVRPPVVSPSQWERFHLPFARPHLTPRQWRTVELFGTFRPYFALPEPFPADVVVDDGLACVRPSVTWWADRHPTTAGAAQRPWTNREPA